MGITLLPHNLCVKKKLKQYFHNSQVCNSRHCILHYKFILVKTNLEKPKYYLLIESYYFKKQSINILFLNRQHALNQFLSQPL